MTISDSASPAPDKSGRADRYKMILARDVNEAETRINALAREGYKFLAFQSAQGDNVYVIMEMDIDTLMDEVKGGGGFMSQG